MNETEKIPSLAETQRWMRWIITDTRGAADAMKLGPSPQPDCRELIEGTSEFPRLERLEIYAESYFQRLLGYFSEDYRRVKLVLGERFFNAIVLDYLSQFPSRYTNMSEIGQDLWKFLSESPVTKDHPALPEIAKLEWIAELSFFADNVPPFEAGQLAAIPPERWPDLKFALDPAVKFLETFFPVHEIWEVPQDCRQEKGWPEKVAAWKPADQPYYLMLYRDNFEVKVESLSAAEYELLQMMDEGARLSELSERPNDFQGLFAQWTGKGIISRVGF